MKRNTMVKILRGMSMAIGQSDKLWLVLSQVVYLSGVPRMTTYRYLNEAVVLGLVEVKERPYRNLIARWYCITRAGRDFAGVV